MAKKGQQMATRSLLVTFSLALAAASSSPAAGGAASVVEESADPHFPRPLVTDLESRLDNTWEFPNDLRLEGTQELVQLGETSQAAAAAAAQPQRAGAPLECECERVKCSCVKRCDCNLPSGPSLLQMQELLIPVGEPAMLELEETAGIVNQELACDCDRVKCNCIKHCECSVANNGGM